MDWASISAIATIALAAATVWMTVQSRKSIILSQEFVKTTQDMYEKDNIPLLAFNFDFDSDKTQMFPRNL